MRKTRAEESPKSRPVENRAALTSKLRGAAVPKEDTVEKKRKPAERRKPSEESRAKPLKSIGPVTSKRSVAAQPERRSLAAESGARTLVSRASSKSEVGTKYGADAAKSRIERTARSEKRGTSTIYMPKSGALSKSTKSSEAIAKSRTGAKSKDTRDVAKRDDAEAKERRATRSRLPSRERRRSRTLSPSEIKVLHSKNAGYKNVRSSSKSRVSEEGAGRETNGTRIEADEEYVYDDDFEDYESDFEECTDSELSEISEATNKSDEVTGEEPIELRTEKQKTTISSDEMNKKSEEDRMLDSGHYELAEARRRAARVEAVSLPRDSKISDTGVMVQSSVSPYRDEKSNEKSLPSSMDEGFEDSRSGDFAKSPPLSRIAFIDFRKSSPSKDNDKATSHTATTARILSRGEKLLEMIKLDIVEWSIHESKPIAYEEYIRTHGRLNTRQICVQTNEDNLDAEVQTDRIECASKWTQFPAKCRTTLKTEDDIRLFNAECRGYGTENDLNTSPTGQTEQTIRPIYDVLRLNEFLEQAGQVVLCLLEEKASGTSGYDDNTSYGNLHELPFSEAAVKLSIDNVTFLAGRAVTVLHYSNSSNSVLLTIHAPVDEDIETSRDEDFVMDCSIGCVWNVSQPSRPVKIFYSSSTITACCFHPITYNIVLAGHEDGSVSVWDLSEAATWHRKIIDAANNCDWIVRSPTYTSAGNPEASGHDSEVVALRVLSKVSNEDEHGDASDHRFVPIQICSVDTNGRLIVWSVLRNMSRTGACEDLGLSWWGELRLVKSQELLLNNRRNSGRNIYLNGCTDMHVDRLDTNALFIATNHANILHATRIGKHASPAVYRSNEMDCCGETKCIEYCPYDQPFFLVGCGDGTVRLHTTTAERPLLQLKHGDSNASIKALQWSRSKPLTIYALDVQSRIHIWDLSISDINPVHSVPTKDWAHVDSIELSPCRTKHELTNQYMALATDNGCVEVHRLRKEFCHAYGDAMKREINTFLRYVEIL